MKASQYYIATIKEAPAEAELISHKLMIRAGLIKRVASGIYTWLPLGLKILRKIEAVVREEMNNIGGLEILMPVVQPAELWQESGRWEMYGKELLRMKDRHERDFCLGPTHEEVIVDLVKHHVKSYKQLPFTMYQIQTKFRDEVRPRFGVMRAREFIMKDAYSFHADFESLTKTYEDMYKAYCNVFTRLGLKFRAVAADTGSIGGTGSHEFQVLADSGEDIIAYSSDSDYAANLELATHLQSDNNTVQNHHLEPVKKTATPTQKTCEEVAKLLNIELKQTVKSLVFEGEDNIPVLVLIRGDHSLNEIKLAKIAGIKLPLTFVSVDVIKQYFNCQPGFIGPVGFIGKIIVDNDVAIMSSFVCGANCDGYHLENVNFKRDVSAIEVVDVRNVVAGDLSPDGHGVLNLCRGIEVGHIFQLRTKYSDMMNLSYLDNNGKDQIVEMGCYGIGVSRILGACIEQNHDEKGIVFPQAMAPFTLVIVPVNYHKKDMVKQVADKLYATAKEKGIDVLLDDRNDRLGSLLADSELLGIPYRILVSEKTLEKGVVEVYSRQENGTQEVALDSVINDLFLYNLI